jgi:hypothetical protein
MNTTKPFQSSQPAHVSDRIAKGISRVVAGIGFLILGIGVLYLVVLSVLAVLTGAEAGVLPL